MKLRLLLVLSLALLSLPARSAARTDALSQARLLHRAAQDNLGDAALETRARAVIQLEEAIRLDPLGRTGNHWRLLGYIRELGAYDEMARGCYYKALAQSPGDRDALLGLGRIARRQFLRTLDKEALQRGIAELDSATRCYPPSSEPWLALVPLLYEWPDLARASIAAEKALAGRPRLPEAGLAAGMMAYRLGGIERADSLFRAAIPKLPADQRELFDHPGRHVGQVAAATARRPGAAPGRAYEPDPVAPRPVAPDALPDPDPTTPQNEVRLEYWARAAHAILLFDDPVRPGLDDRAETYLRYGPPAKVLWNPLGMNLYFRPNLARTNWADDPHSGSLEEYAFDAQIWYYPELNMQVLFHDRALHGHYTVPALREPLENSEPDSTILTKRQDLLSLGDGFAVFPTLPPRDQRLDVLGTLMKFEGRDGPRLAAFVQADGETLEARWAVTDASGQTVARGAQGMERSLCGERVRSGTEFTADLPPGRYEVVVSARDAHGRRGVARRSLDLRRPDGLLSMSDLVPCCGEPSLLVQGGSVRLEPLPDGVVRGTAPLTVYFEIYHLDEDSGGLSRYMFDYVVERIVRDRRTGEATPTGTMTTWVSREEVFRGDVRRQFLTLPIAKLPPGEYRVTVTVRDLVGRMIESGSATFARQ